MRYKKFLSIVLMLCVTSSVLPCQENPNNFGQSFNNFEQNGNKKSIRARAQVSWAEPLAVQIPYSVWRLGQENSRLQRTRQSATEVWYQEERNLWWHNAQKSGVLNQIRLGAQFQFEGQLRQGQQLSWQKMRKQREREKQEEERQERMRQLGRELERDLEARFGAKN